jgi:hypothetical protein
MVRLRILLRQAGGVGDIGEEEGDRAGWQFDDDGPSVLRGPPVAAPPPSAPFLDTRHLQIKSN